MHCQNESNLTMNTDHSDIIVNKNIFMRINGYLGSVLQLLPF